MTATKKEKPTEVKKPALPGRVALSSLTLQNVLSFGAEAKVDLEPLNVLIGPNGCGKSNLMDIVALLKAAATTDLSDEFRGDGLEWPWKDEEEMTLRVQSDWIYVGNVFHHDMLVRVHESGAYDIFSESLGAGKFSKLIGQGPGANSRDSVMRGASPIFAYDALEDYLKESRPDGNVSRPDGLDDLRRDFPRAMSDVWIYRNRHVGRGIGRNPLRVAARADGRKDRVSETLDNFSLVLNRVYADSACKDAINEKMRKLHARARGIYFNVAHGMVAAALEEAENRTIPASRMSDGMLNWLFLMTVLLDPNPPALVCIEEPETGLHPDMLPTLARTLIDASSRMQLIVTTHSDMLVSCFTDRPEAVVVCDMTDGATKMKRLRAEDFNEWKEEGLGMAWISGAIGGKRW